MNKGPILSVELTYTNVNSGGDDLVDEELTLEATLMGLTLLNWGFNKIQRLVGYIKITFSRGYDNKTNYQFKLMLRPMLSVSGCWAWVNWEKESGKLKYYGPEGGTTEPRSIPYKDFEGAYYAESNIITGIKTIIIKVLMDEASRRRDIAAIFDNAAELVRTVESKKSE